MDTEHCTLCHLPLPDPPIKKPGTDNTFCCTGCLHVHDLLENMDEKEAESLRQETIARRREELELREGENEKQTLPENYKETFLAVEGMHCSTCEAFLETLASSRKGIYRCEASYATELMKVVYNPDEVEPKDLPNLLSGLGYLITNNRGEAQESRQNELARLLIGGFLGIIGLIQYILFLYPSYLGAEFIPVDPSEKLFFASNIFVMTTFILLYTGFPILRSAFVAITVLKPNVDLLITIAALSAYLYSCGALLIGSPEVYFDVTMAIILVVSIGNYYEKSIKDSKNSLLSQLTRNEVKEARLLNGGNHKKVAVEDITPGERILVKAGERIPIDGTIIEGNGAVNQALMTGESLPVTKKKGDRVQSGTTLMQNSLTVEADAHLTSTLDELKKAMWNIQSTRPGQQRLADRIATYFVPGVLILSLLTFIFYIMQGYGFTQTLLTSLAVLIVSCPCALGLATPLAISSGIKWGLQHHIIYKSPAIFEDDTQPDVIAFDKTGTLTSGKMKLLDSGNHQKALEFASALESLSSHPVAQPIASALPNQHIHNKVNNFESFSRGVNGIIDGNQIFVGEPEWLTQKGFHIEQSMQVKIVSARNEGNIAVAVAWDQTIQSLLIVGDEMRPEAPELIWWFRKQGTYVAVITGDRKEAGERLKKHLNPDFLFTETQPESKSAILKELKRLGNVAMIGDGSNDAPALAQADRGIAFGDLTAIAADSAQIVIMVPDLNLVKEALLAIKKTRLRVKQNLGWAFLYNVVTIPLAILGLINPLFAALAMAASSLIVVANSSRDMAIRPSVMNK